MARLQIYDGHERVQDVELGRETVTVGRDADPHQTGQVPGAGLGLGIARHIVQEHGGDIRIVSPTGSGEGGTRVSLILPLGTEHAGVDTGDAVGARQPEVPHVR